MSDQDIRNTFAIGGLIVGFYAGNPALGYLVGSAIGSHIAGPMDGGEGPRLEDLDATRADYGAPIPKVYGAMRVPGNLIWAEPYKEKVHKETVGDSFLSSGTTVTTYSYTASFACALCQGAIVGVRRIWANGKLVYDRRSEAAYQALVRTVVTVTYKSNHTQVYAVTINGSLYGTSGDLQSTADAINSLNPRVLATVLPGNRLQIEQRDTAFALSVTNAFASDENLNQSDAASIVTENIGDTRDASLLESARFGAYITVYNGNNLQDPDPTIEAVEGEGNVPAYRDTAYIVFKDLPLANYGNALPRIECEVVASGATESEVVDAYTHQIFGSWGVSGGLSGAPTGEAFSTVTEYSHSLAGPWTSKEAALKTLNAGLSEFNQARAFVFYRASGGPYIGLVSAYDQILKESAFLDTQAILRLFYYHHAVTSALNVPGRCNNPIDHEWHLMPNLTISKIRRPNEAQEPGAINSSVCDGGLVSQFRVSAGLLYARISPVAPPATCQDGSPCGQDGIATVPGTGGQWCVSCDGTVSRNLTWSPVTGTFKQLQALTYGDTSKLTILKRDVGPVVPLGDPRYDDQDFWVSAAAAANIGGTYGVDYPVVVTSAYKASYTDTWLDANPRALNQVVADLCAEAGLAPGQYDTSALTGSVIGYAVTRPMAARSALEPLALAYEFEAVERDGVLVFLHRGGAAVASLTADDIGAGPEGESRASLELDRTEDSELPRSVTVLYADTLRDYQPQTQRASRQQAGTRDARMSLPLALTDAQAAAIAERQLWRAWAERETLSTGVLRTWSRLEPGDVINLSDGEIAREARILRTRHLGHRLMLECVSQQQAVFALTRTGQAGQGSRAVVGFAGPTSLLWVDSTLVSDADEGAGAYVVLTGTGKAWGGAAVYRSLDDGKNWSIAATTDLSAAFGACASVLPARDGELLYRTDTLDITISAGDYAPASVTEADLLNGANRALVGIDGRWELIGWLTAQMVDAVTWRLTGLLRGQRGTEWAASLHQDGDTFIPIASLTRLQAELSSVGAERKLRAVTFGQSLAAAHTEGVTLTAHGLKPYAPAHLRGWRSSSGSLYISWFRRSRTAGDWLDDADTPLGEASARFEVDILDSNGAVLRTLTLSDSLTPPHQVVYASADQVTDFGSNQSAISVRVYQLSDTVGRGYPAEATL